MHARNQFDEHENGFENRIEFYLKAVKEGEIPKKFSREIPY